MSCCVHVLCVCLSQVEQAQADSHRVVGAFVTFKNETGKLACLKALPNSRMRQWWYLKAEHKLRQRYVAASFYQQLTVAIVSWLFSASQLQNPIVCELCQLRYLQRSSLDWHSMDYACPQQAGTERVLTIPMSKQTKMARKSSNSLVTFMSVQAVGLRC